MASFDQLNQISQRNATSALKFSFDKDTQQLTSKSSWKMTLRSGVTRIVRAMGFHATDSGKANSHQQKNTASIGALLNYIESESSSFVRDYVEQGAAKLGGDKEDANYTVRHRWSRGSYVSKGMVAKMKQLALEGASKEREAKNQQLLEAYISKQEPPPLGSDKSIFPQNRAVRDNCGLTDLVGKLRQKGGTPDWPVAKYEQSWKFLQDNVNAHTDPNNPEFGKGFVPELKVHLQNLVHKANSQGISLSQDQMDKAASAFLTRKTNFSQVIRASNSEKVGDFLGDNLKQSVTNLATAVANWPENADPTLMDNTITREECEWAANQLANYENAGGFASKFKRDYQVAPQVLDETMNDMHQAVKDEANKFKQMREDINAAKPGAVQNTNKIATHKVASMLHDAIRPEEITDKTIANLLTPSLVKLIHLRRAAQKQGTAQDNPAELKLQGQLAHYPGLKNVETSTWRGGIPTLQMGKISSTSEFVKAKLDADGTLARMKSQSNDYPRLESSLKVLDDYADFKAQLQDIENNGGLSMADDKTIDNIQKKARALQGQRQTLEAFAELCLDAADGISELYPVLGDASDTIEAGIEPYLNISKPVQSYRAQNMLSQLPHIQAMRNQENNSTSLANIGERPSQIAKGTLMNALVEADAGDKGFQALMSWTKKAAPVLDQFAAFAMVSNDLAHLESKNSKDLSKNEKLKLKNLQKQYKALQSGIKTFRNETEKLQKALGNNLQPPLSQPMQTLTATGQLMADRLERRAFMGAHYRNPDPVSSNQIPAQGWNSLQATGNTVVSIAENMPGHGGFKASGSAAVLAKNTVPKFQHELAEKMRTMPLPTGQNQQQLAQLNSLAQQATQGLNDVLKARQELAALRKSVVQSAGLLPQVPGHWSASDSQPRVLTSNEDASSAYLDAIDRLDQQFAADQVTLQNLLSTHKEYLRSI